MHKGKYSSFKWALEILPTLRSLPFWKYLFSKMCTITLTFLLQEQQLNPQCQSVGCLQSEVRSGFAVEITCSWVPQLLLPSSLGGAELNQWWTTQRRTWLEVSYLNDNVCCLSKGSRWDHMLGTARHPGNDDLSCESVLKFMHQPDRRSEFVVGKHSFSFQMFPSWADVLCLCSRWCCWVLPARSHFSLIWSAFANSNISLTQLNDKKLQGWIK